MVLVDVVVAVAVTVWDSCFAAHGDGYGVHDSGADGGAAAAFDVDIDGAAVAAVRSSDDWCGKKGRNRAKKKTGVDEEDRYDEGPDGKVVAVLVLVCGISGMMGMDIVPFLYFEVAIGSKLGREHSAD